MVRFKTRWLLLSVDDQPLISRMLARDNLGAATMTSSYPVMIPSAAPKVAASLTPQLITRLLRASLLQNFGDVASGAFAGVLTCRYYSTHTGTAIIRCTREAARLVWAAATLISSPTEASSSTPIGSVENGGSICTSLRIRVIHCGGTIKKVQTKAIELDRKTILRLRRRQRQHLTQADPEPYEASNKAVTENVSSSSNPQPLAPVHDEEDLGEALEPVEQPTPIRPLTSDSSDQAAMQIKPGSQKPDLDPETTALLAQSKKLISSIAQ